MTLAHNLDLCCFLSFFYNCDVPVCALAILRLNITLLNSVNIPVFTLKILEALSLQPCLDAVTCKGGGVDNGDNTYPWAKGVVLEYPQPPEQKPLLFTAMTHF